MKGGKQKLPGYAEQLAEYIVHLDLCTVPQPVVSHANHLFLDLIGAALAGVDTPEAQATMMAVESITPGGGPCTMWGTSHKSSPSGAALFNGVIAHARELDDFGGADHSGAVVVPAVLAVAEAYPQITGKKILESLVVGYEIGRRVLDGAGGYRSHNHGDGYHSTGTCGSFAAAAAVAKALDLNSLQTTWALGLAGSFTGGTWAFAHDSAMSKRYHVGRAAETGVTAGCFARSNFSGPAYIFEEQWGGFFTTYARHGCHPGALVDRLGETYGIMRSGIKPYAACRDIHSTLDVILAARHSHKLASDDIMAIKVYCIPEMIQMVGTVVSPKTRFEAQLSLPYSIGVALVTGRAFIEEYENPLFHNPEILYLANSVEMIEDSALPFDSEPYVVILTKDGRSIKGHVDYASGAPQNPLAPEDVIEKFRILASSTHSQSQVSQLKNTILDLRSLSDVRLLTRLLQKDT